MNEVASQGISKAIQYENRKLLKEPMKKFSRITRETYEHIFDHEIVKKNRQNLLQNHSSIFLKDLTKTVKISKGNLRYSVNTLWQNFKMFTYCIF